MFKKSFFILFVVFFVLFSMPKTVFAKESAITLEPAYKEVILSTKSQEESFEIKIKNSSPEDISLEIFPIDFKSSGIRGGYTFLGQGAGYSYSLSSFLSFETERLDIDANKERRLLVTVKNRPSLSPGGHYAAVVARLVNDGIDKDQSPISPALSSLIFMRKQGGEIFNLFIKEVTFAGGAVSFGRPKNLEILFQNDGNVHLVPYGTITVKDVFGRQIYDGTLNTSSAFILPETRRILAADVKSVAWETPVSFNQVSIEGTDSLKKTKFLYKDSYLYVNPYSAIIILALFGILIVKRSKFRKRKTIK